MLVPRRVDSYENRFIDRKSTGPPVGPWPSSMAGVATNIAAAPSLKSFKASIAKQKQAATPKNRKPVLVENESSRKDAGVFLEIQLEIRLYFWMDFSDEKMSNNDTSPMHRCIASTWHLWICGTFVLVVPFVVQKDSWMLHQRSTYHDMICRKQRTKTQDETVVNSQCLSGFLFGDA